MSRALKPCRTMSRRPKCRTKSARSAISRRSASFAERVMRSIKPLVASPLVESLWPLVLERNPAQTNLGLRLAQGRHALEETWQNDTLELPQSAVCQLPEFAWFLAHVLAHLPRFWSAHNDALAAYRTCASACATGPSRCPIWPKSDGWLEAPFWIWSADDPRRRPLFAQQSADELVITDRHRTLDLALAFRRCRRAAAVEQLLALAVRGIKIRTRALTTTLFARLVLSDLFLHGIGGAKYDQVTDQIARSSSASRRRNSRPFRPRCGCPSPTCRETTSESELTQQMRELRYHPERYVEANGQLPAEKFLLSISSSPQSGAGFAPRRPANARERHVAIAAANESLQPYVNECGTKSNGSGRSSLIASAPTPS